MTNPPNPATNVTFSRIRSLATGLLFLPFFTGCNSVNNNSFGPFDIRNDARHNATIATDLVLVPGVPFETNQNVILRRADDSGRDFSMLMGPYPRLGTPARITARNELVETVTTHGFLAAIGKQPIVIIRYVRTSSSHTHYLCWAGPANTDYVFVEQADPEHPVVLTPEPGSTFAPVSLTTGQFATITDSTVTVGTYFDATTPGALAEPFPPDLTDFVTYVRSREVAAGFVPQGSFFTGIYSDGIPGLRGFPKAN